MLSAIRRFTAGLMLPLKGSVFLFQHRSLLRLAVAPLLLNTVLYGATLGLFIHSYNDLFALLMDRPDAWYWLVGYYVLRLLAFILIGAVFLFSFTLVGTVLAAPFLERLSERTEAVLRAPRTAQPFRLTRWAADVFRVDRTCLHHAPHPGVDLPPELPPGRGSRGLARARLPPAGL
jgi:uncharacterized protein involved in cysteine biosynthesis